jgi:hypothetical protein
MLLAGAADFFADAFLLGVLVRDLTAAAVLLVLFVDEDFANAADTSSTCPRSTSETTRVTSYNAPSTRTASASGSLESMVTFTAVAFLPVRFWRRKPPRETKPNATSSDHHVRLKSGHWHRGIWRAADGAPV